MLACLYPCFFKADLFLAAHICLKLTNLNNPHDLAVWITETICVCAYGDLIYNRPRCSTCHPCSTCGYEAKHGCACGSIQHCKLLFNIRSPFWFFFKCQFDCTVRKCTWECSIAISKGCTPLGYLIFSLWSVPQWVQGWKAQSSGQCVDTSRD